MKNNQAANHSPGLRSPEDMRRYIRVLPASALITLFLLLAALTAILLWCVLGVISIRDVSGNIIELHPIELLTN